LNGIIVNNEDLVVVEMLAKSIGEMIIKDGIELWLEPLGEFKSWVESDVKNLECYLVIMIHILSGIDL
jgi:hypothetical protein